MNNQKQILGGIPISKLYWLIFFASALFITSCGLRIERKIQGMWVIDSITYEAEEIRGYFLHNFLIFEESGKLLVPITLENENEDENGKWYLQKSDSASYLVLESNLLPFDGKFEFEYLEGSERYGPRLNLVKSDCRIECTKSFPY